MVSLLINDQYNLTDTNQITIVSNSFKIGANYTVVTVSGIGSVGTGTFPNPVYPDAGIALSTGTTWASSIPNNSTNWNTAFSDRLKWDGGNTGLVAATGRTSLGGTTIGQSMFTLTNPSAITFPRFNADNTVTARTAANFRSDIGAGTVTSVNIASGTPMSITNNTTTPEISMAAATGSVNGYLTSTDWTTFNGKQNALGFTPANSTITINTTSPLQGGGDLSNNRTLSILSASDSQSGIVTTTSQLFGGSKVFKNRVTVDSVLTLNTTTAIPNQILGINTVGNVNSVGKLSLGAGLSITSSTLLADTNLLITRYDTASMLTPYLRKADTSLLNLTSRFAEKQNTLVSTVNIKTLNGNNLLGSGDLSLTTGNTFANGTLNYIPVFSSSTDIINSPIFRNTLNNQLRFESYGLSSDKRVSTSEYFTEPITISTNCGSSGAPNVIGTSTGNYVNNCSSATAYLLLPDPSNATVVTTGRTITITNLRSGQSIVLNTTFSYSNARPLGIDGSTVSSISAKRWITVQSNGTNWYIIATGSAL
jgi:hypothetical protein